MIFWVFLSSLSAPFQLFILQASSFLNRRFVVVHEKFKHKSFMFDNPFFNFFLIKWCVKVSFKKEIQRMNLQILITFTWSRIKKRRLTTVKKSSNLLISWLNYKHTQMIIIKRIDYRKHISLNVKKSLLSHFLVQKW